MPRAPKTVQNQTKNLTKSEREYLEKAEKAALSGMPIVEFKKTKKDKIAHKEFVRVIALLDAVGKNDGMFEAVINDYCMYLSDIERYRAYRLKFENDIEELSNSDMDSGALLSKGEDGIIESRANPNHDPKDGRFATEASSQGANEFKVKGFRNNQHFNNHWEKHRNEYISEGVKTKEDYLQKALALIQSPCDNGIEGYKNKLNQICRYDVKTNDFVKGSIDKGIFTMFKPEDVKKYFDDLKKIEGVEDLDE